MSFLSTARFGSGKITGQCAAKRFLGHTIPKNKDCWPIDGETAEMRRQNRAFTLNPEMTSIGVAVRSGTACLWYGVDTEN